MLQNKISNKICGTRDTADSSLVINFFQRSFLKLLFQLSNFYPLIFTIKYEMDL
jgi:hypothetical protein